MRGLNEWKNALLLYKYLFIILKKMFQNFKQNLKETWFLRMYEYVDLVLVCFIIRQRTAQFIYLSLSHRSSIPT